MIDTELTESVRREKHLLLGAVGHNHFGPVDHRRGDELQRQSAEVKRLSFSYHLHVPYLNTELRSHDGCLLGANDGGIGVFRKESAHRTAVVGLHVLADEVVRLAAGKRLFYFLQPLVAATGVHCVHHCHFLFSEHHVTVVAHAFRQLVLALEQIQLGVIAANIFYHFIIYHLVIYLIIESFIHFSL